MYAYMGYKRLLSILPIFFSIHRPEKLWVVTKLITRKMLLLPERVNSCHKRKSSCGPVKISLKSISILISISISISTWPRPPQAKNFESFLRVIVLWSGSNLIIDVNFKSSHAGLKLSHKLGLNCRFLTF